MTTTESEPKADFGATPKEDSESFGTWLRRQRELREITLREIADTSKISLRYLQALEDDRFELLPAPVFAKGFLRQYARYVGIDPEEAVNFYLTADGLAKEEEEDEPVTQRRPRAVGTWPYALAVVVVALLMMAFVGILQRLNRSSESPEEAVDRSAERPVATPSVAAGPPAVETVEGSPADAGPPEPAAAEPVGEEAPAAAPDPLYVTLDFRDDCWVRATVDGETREDRVYTQGESLQLNADELVELELGNAFVVDVEVEGHPMEIDPSSKNPVRRFSIDRETAASLKRGATR